MGKYIYSGVVVHAKNVDDAYNQFATMMPEELQVKLRNSITWVKDKAEENPYLENPLSREEEASFKAAAKSVCAVCRFRSKCSTCPVHKVSLCVG